MLKNCSATTNCFGVMVSTMPVMAAESADSLSAEPVVANLLSSLGESGNFSAVKTLKDANDENRYSYLPFSSGGYLIYDSEFDIILSILHLPAIVI